MKKTKKSSKNKSVLKELKSTVLKEFNVDSSIELRSNSRFQMAIDGLGKIDLRRIDSWKVLYRKFIGIIPGEEDLTGYGCINGVDIFKYFQPWKVLNLNPSTSTTKDIKKAYYDLSKIYHPDNPNTGDARIFDRINTMYKSINI